MKYDVFFSYSRKDTEIVDKILATLTEAGLTCFIDRKGIDGGADFPVVITEAILESRLLLFIASKNSYASEFTQKELTFAVSNKGSRFIFPLIIDGEPLPKDLEFLLSNINWRTLSSSYRIEKEMLAEIQKRLTDPKAGMTLEMRKSHTLTRTVILVVAAAVAAVVLVLYFQNSVQSKRTEEVQNQLEAAEDAVLEAGDQYTLMLSDARTCVSKADALWAQENPFQTYEEEISLLENADSLVQASEQLRLTHATKRAIYKSYFPEDQLREARKLTVGARETRFNFWKETALNIYRESYLKQPDFFRDFLLQVLDKAIRLKADDELADIKNLISNNTSSL